MSIENTETPDNVTASDDQDAFENEFYGRNETQPDKTKSEEVEDQTEDDEDVATEPVEEEQEVDTQDSEDEDDDLAPEDNEGSKGKPKRNRFQERIDQLVAEAREAERRAIAAEAALKEREKIQKPDETPKPENKTVNENKAPAPNDVNEDGTEKYPLGEFDPNFLKDTVKYTLDEEQRVREAEAAKIAQQKERERQTQELHQSWNERLGPAQERYPDFQERGQELINSFDGLDPNYAEYITNTLMSLDNGPDVLYYLASNPEEAHKIVESGATKATIALGRISAMVGPTDSADKQTGLRVSNAPTPPPRNKGSSVAKPTVAQDTNDLDAFERQFFKKR